MAIIDEIKAAEEKAQKIKDDAKAAARADSEIIETEAKNKAADMKNKAAEEAAAAQSKAEAEAKAASDKARAETEKECESLMKSGREHIREAAELIFKGACDI